MTTLTNKQTCMICHLENRIPIKKIQSSLNEPKNKVLCVVKYFDIMFKYHISNGFVCKKA